MLAKPNRLTRGSDYKTTVRRGSRCAGAHTVTYVGSSAESGSPRFGFIVSRQVGSAVTRNTIRRRLKAVCAEALPSINGGASIVIRALPSAATVDYATLRADVVRCLQRKAVA
ncbi:MULTISPECIES: ribonuclease P protein component [unclassified Microbacterium]|uniref:ribonuclease P protein component n=1 Tax=unclassified Microbacterium TaxID=2609290 RepID=UPI0006FF23CE|nr:MULTISPECIES: ribonuclease P protein component [unclassified Microbacterium]MBD8207503.1 ribonuclease P protein component [Microbacterium sp. CFBP 8801]MBD8217393.1 ribonuclease P protein component [Microbacterium sp. CFBP 13617]MBD8477078.1 ribonuclease P protein component [Microbacterium sp. CFBP 8794]MBD8509063.1 ribonuclease P protein component [Microbacterium sp. CFBP 8790]AOX45925.1 ribonuclease P protein component [Microbacterium sp. BH-3-3-3]